MRLSYHHVNPEGGNESFLLRVSWGDDDAKNTCVLVDAGAKANVDEVLGPDDRLAGVCLTHAHLDHYQSIESCRREGTRILASPPTASVLEGVFDVAAREYDVSTTDRTLGAVEPIDDWTRIADGFEVRPVPAGHVPGAAGFLFRIDDGTDDLTVLATGDFTERQAGGYPGLTASSFLDVDVLFLTAATNDTFESNLSKGLGRALQRSHSGARTLVATSGLLGVQAAYLLSELGRAYDRSVPIHVVGQVAKIYETLEYDCENVIAIPEFTDPSDCIAMGAITIAGPEVPQERSSGRIFGLLRDDPSACVVQLLGSGEDPLQEGQCTIHAYRIANHPSQETLHELHDAITPHHTVVVHEHGGAGNKYNNLDSVVWSPDDSDEYTLFDDGGWRTPPWMPTNRIQNRATTVQNLGGMGEDVIGQLSLPGLTRCETPDLESEGIDREIVDEIVLQQNAYAVPQTADDVGSELEPDEPETDTATQETEAMAKSDDSGTTDEDSTSDSGGGVARLYDTATIEFDEIDPQITALLDAGDVDPEDVAAVLRVAAEYDPESPASSQVAGPDVALDGVSDPSLATGTAGDDTESDDVNATGDDDEVTADSPSTSEEGTEESDDAQGDHVTDDEPPGKAVEIHLTPLSYALATTAVEANDGDTIEDFVASSITDYIEASLDGTIDGASPVDEFADSSPLTRALESTVERDDRFEDVTDAIAAGLIDEPVDDLARSVSIPGMEPYLSLMDAIADNDANAVSTREDVVTAAVIHRTALL